MTLPAPEATIRAAVEAVDPARATADLQRLVAFPSITGSEELIQDDMARLMAEIGLEVRRVDTDPVVFANDPDFPGSEMPRTALPVVIGRLGGVRPGPRVILVGHVDVVPPGDPDTWASDPFVPRISEGNLYGRGPAT